jgi:hypothetical protein
MERWLKCRVVDPLTKLSNRTLSKSWSLGAFSTGLARHTSSLGTVWVSAPFWRTDLAVEVVSSETANRLQTQINLYFKHGSQIQINHPNGHGETLEQDQILEDPSVLPGFSTPVSAIFEGL